MGLMGLVEVGPDGEFDGGNGVDGFDGGGPRFDGGFGGGGHLVK